MAKAGEGDPLGWCLQTPHDGVRRHQGGPKAPAATARSVRNAPGLTPPGCVALSGWGWGDGEGTRRGRVTRGWDRCGWCKEAPHAEDRGSEEAPGTPSRQHMTTPCEQLS